MEPQQRHVTQKGRKDKKAVHKGWLEKRGPSEVYGWARHWCVLTDDCIDFYIDQTEEDESRKMELVLSEYTKTTDFKKKDAPGESAKHLREKPYGFVVDNEPYLGPESDDP